jgi:hypothetical protein
MCVLEVLTAVILGYNAEQSLESRPTFRRNTSLSSSELKHAYCLLNVGLPPDQLIPEDEGDTFL